MKLAAQSFLGDLREGWREFASRTWVWVIVVAASIGNMMTSVFVVLGAVISKTSLGGAGAWATILAALGVGSLVGGLVSLRVHVRHPLFFGSSLLGFMALPTALLALRAPVIVIAAGALLGGGGNMIFNALWETALQQHIPPAALSRVSAYDWFGSLAFQPIGLVVAGPAAVAFGASTTLWIAAAGTFAMAVLAIATPSVAAASKLRPRARRRAASRHHAGVLPPNLTTAPTYTRDVHDALRRRAREGLVSEVERAPARAHFRAMGIDPARLGGPIVGIASTWTGTMPCNLNQRELADRVADGVTAAGGVPLEFNTIAVSDNQSQATPGMRASLISREVIADSIELMVHAHDFDALVCVVGCDKTVPAALMALARVDKPAVVLYSGPMRAGRLRGREVTIQDVWEAVGAEERGLIPRAELDELERVACPGPGTCAGHFTANTMAVALDCLGITNIGDGLIPADETAAKSEAAARAGARAVELAATARTVPRPARASERDGGHRRDRRLDERDPAPARDRPRGRRAADARRARRHRQPDARDREPRAVGPLHGRGSPPRRRNGSR